MNLSKIFKKTWNLVLSKWQFSVIAIVLDALFLVAFSRLNLELITLSKDVLNSLQGSISDVTNSLNAVQMLSINSKLAETPGFNSLFSELMKFIAGYALAMFVVFLLFKGISFAISHYMRGSGFWKPLLRFSYVSLISAVLFSIIMTGGVVLFSIVAFSPVSFLSIPGLKFIMWVLSVALGYFTYISLLSCGTTNPIRNGIMNAVKKWKACVLALIAISFGGTVILLDSWFLWQFYMPAGIVCSFMLFPYLFYFRQFMTEMLYGR